ncbi:MAG: histidine phosphotransferase family protein [Alphaproteobacteria bacterium]|nr:histidine phosphotransferase family protein [Alphaproteobacteria bacterium]
MTSTIALEILASKICHDIISPIGAIHNGLEIMEELADGPSVPDDVIELIAESAKQASARLQTFRLAYGLGGANSDITLRDVHQTLNGYLAGDGKIRQIWSPHDLTLPDPAPRGLPKIVACGLMLMAEALPRGGTLDLQEHTGHWDIIANGEQAGLFDVQKDALAQHGEWQIEPRAAHAQITHTLARHYGILLEYLLEDKACILRLIPPIT